MIRQAGSECIPLIRELCFKVWPQTYEKLLPKAKIDYMLGLMYSEAGLLRQMENGTQFILVYDDSEPVGYGAYIEKPQGILHLDKIYVLPGQQGKGVGKFIIDYVVNLALERKARA